MRKLIRETIKELIKEAMVEKLSSKPEPAYGERSIWGYHGTSLDYLPGIKRHGLDNRIGREAGGGLDAMYQGLIGPVVSNWVYTPELALGFAESYGEKGVLLKFDTSRLRGDYPPGIKSNADYEEFVFYDNKNFKKYYAKPKSSEREFFHKFEIGERPHLQHGGFEEVEPIEALSRLDFSETEYYDNSLPADQKCFDPNKVVSLDYSKLNKDWIRIQGNSFKRFRRSFSDQVRSSKEPIPSHLIEFSLDGGKTFYPISLFNVS
jgi:hypothetical protein